MLGLERPITRKILILDPIQMGVSRFHNQGDVVEVVAVHPNYDASVTIYYIEIILIAQSGFPVNYIYHNSFFIKGYAKFID